MNKEVLPLGGSYYPQSRRRKWKRLELLKRRDFDEGPWTSEVGRCLADAGGPSSENGW